MARAIDWDKVRRQRRVTEHGSERFSYPKKKRFKGNGKHRRRHRKEKRLPYIIQKLMHIYGPGFECGATWERRAGQWKCVKAADMIGWMVGLTAVQGREAMAQRPEWSWKWEAPATNGIYVPRG